MNRPLAFILITCLLASSALAQDEARLLRFPAIHADQIVFTCAGDLYSVPSCGGVARKLTSHEGFEMFARFSPDGKYIAFSYGPEAQEMVGGLAPGWNICVSDMNGKWVQITTDGNHNKEPDWVPVPSPARQKQ